MAAMTIGTISPNGSDAAPKESANAAVGTGHGTAANRLRAKTLPTQANSRRTIHAAAATAGRNAESGAKRADRIPGQRSGYGDPWIRCKEGLWAESYFTRAERFRPVGIGTLRRDSRRAVEGVKVA